MRNYKKVLLDYGLEKGYYTPDEYQWCMKGKSIDDYDTNHKNLKNKPANETGLRPDRMYD